MKQLYVVWYSNGDGWRPSRPMTKEFAESHAETLESQGFATMIRPQFRTTLDDILED
ncbi:hypothetical protein [Alicyclobacillus sp.]|uniref:hypothetical protein n=1 Tax=Alicyclobacillus sp. TaxID=61169 RepID=UPI0025C0258A|nr:hypothetical protein [Alicyclobacillus sp.]MCL6516992.1 hypothetical protein [Alicyclobacillus sp.]